MTINDKTLQKLQKLSSLNIDKSSKDKIVGDIQEMLDFVDNLNSLDISHIDATFTTIEGGTPLREDTSFKSDVATKVIHNSPKNDGEFFIVPKIIE